MKLSFVTAVAALATTGVVLACAASGATLLSHRAPDDGLTASAMTPGQIDAYDACLRAHHVVDMSWSATEETCRQEVESGAAYDSSAQDQ